MSKYLSIFLFLFTGLYACKKKPEDVIADANKKYEAINKKLNDYTQKRVDDITSRGTGTIAGYYREEELKKMYTEHFTDTNRVFIEYYFDDGMLVLVLEQNFKYNRPNTYTEEKARADNDSVWYDDKKTVMEVSRFYFNKNTLVKWYKAGQEVAPTTTEFINRQPVIWAEAALGIKKLKETRDTPNP